MFTGLCAGDCLLSILLSLSLWWRWGRAPKKVPAAPLFAPPRLPKRLAGQGQPPGLSPAQRQYLANDCQPHSSSLVALFLRCTARAGAGS